MLTTKAAAERLGITPMRIRQLIVAHIIPAERLGRDYLIAEDALGAAEQRRRTGWTKGRPRRQKEQQP